MSGGGNQRMAELATIETPAWVTDRRRARPYDYATESYRRLLQLAEGPDWQRDGIADTPDRAARAFAELTAGYRVDPASLFTTFDADGYDELVMVKDIPFYSLCEHHLLPMMGTAAVAYIARGRIVGLSKLARLVEVFARRLQTQERITSQVADTLEEQLDPAGVLVVLRARHLCLEMRGARAAGSETVTNDVRGLFRHAPQSRAEALSLLGL
jgi:GTP cyclohydrolase IA